MKKLFIIFVAILWFSGKAWGVVTDRDFYFSNAGDDNQNTENAACHSDHPCKSIGAIYNCTVLGNCATITRSAGTTYHFNGGDVFNDRTLNINSAGTSSSPITAKSYGTGQAVIYMPTTTYSNTGWSETVAGSHIWHKTITGTAPTYCYYNILGGKNGGRAGRKKTTTASLYTLYHWTYSTPDLYIYWFQDPATAGTTLTSIGTSRQNNAVQLSGSASYVVIDDLDLRGSGNNLEGQGVVTDYGNYNEVKNCNISQGSLAGIYSRSTATRGSYHDNNIFNTCGDQSQAITTNGRGFKVYNNHVYDNYNIGIDLMRDSSKANYVKVYGNQVTVTSCSDMLGVSSSNSTTSNCFADGSVGIYADGAYNSEIYNNYVKGGSPAIGVADERGGQPSYNIYVHHNITYEGYTRNIGQLSGGTYDGGGNYWYNNTTVDAATREIQLFFDPTGTYVYNNLFMDRYNSGASYQTSGVAAQNYGATSNTIWDYNSYLYLGNTLSTSFFYLNGVDYTRAQFADWKTATGYDAHSEVIGINDPTVTHVYLDKDMWDATTPSDYHPTYLASCIDSGTIISGQTLTADYSGNPIWGTPDRCGAYEYQPPYVNNHDSIDVGGGARFYAGSGSNKFRSLATETGTKAVIAITPTSTPTTYSTYADLTISTWNTTGTCRKTFVLDDVDSGAGNMQIVANGFNKNTLYDMNTLNISGSKCESGRCLSDGDGKLDFTYSGAYPVTLDIAESTMAMKVY